MVYLLSWGRWNNPLGFGWKLFHPGQNSLNYQEYDHRYTAQDLHSLILLKIKNQIPIHQVAESLYTMPHPYTTHWMIGKNYKRPRWREGKWGVIYLILTRIYLWKTGTSFGFRMLGPLSILIIRSVFWAGNSNGEGMVNWGVKVAAPFIWCILEATTSRK